MNTLARLSVATGLGLLALSASSARAATIFSEDFGSGATGNTAISNIGWLNDIYTQDNRVFANADGVVGNNAVYSYANANGSEAFYTTSSLAGGFSDFAIADYTDLTFSVEIDTGFGGATTNARFIVQIGGSWFVSTTFLGNPTATPAAKTLAFDPAAANWQTLTVTGVGGLNSPVTIGGTAGADLSGTITGVGVLGVHAGNGTVNFDNYLITGTLAAVPEPSAFALLGGLAALGCVTLRRRRAAPTR